MLHILCCIPAKNYKVYVLLFCNQLIEADGIYGINAEKHTVPSTAYTLQSWNAVLHISELDSADGVT